MIEIFSYQFFQNALIAGALAGIVAGFIGSFVVLKKISFITGSVAHASFGGLGIAYFLGMNPVVGAMIFSVLSALGVGVVSRKANKNEDALIGAMWAIGMSVGLIFIFLTPGYAADLFSFLFGNILLVTTEEIILIFVLAIIVVLSVVLLFNRLVALIFDEEFVEVINVRVLPLYLFLLGLVALAVVALIKVVGIILVIALLTLPAATANLFSKSVKGVIAWSVIFAVLITEIGILLAYIINWPTGPVIIFLAAILYLIVFLVKLKK